MKLMSDSMSPLRTLPGFIDMIKGLENPFLGIIVGSLFTALIQSSGAFAGIVIVLAQQGFIMFCFKLLVYCFLYAGYPPLQI